MTIPRITRRLTASVVLLLGMATGGDGALGGPPQATLEREQITLQLADETRPAVRGTLVVPLRHEDANAPTIEIGYVRLFGERRLIPPIFYLAGGPGLPGTRPVEPGRRLSELVRLFLRHTDLIFIDQRGAGSASPRLSCPERIDLPAAPAADEATTLAAMRRAGKLCAGHWRREGIDLSAFNTQESAHDLELLRQALSLEKVTLLGGSYGSHLAFSYIRKFGSFVDRAVLSGIEGPDHTYKLPLQIDGLLKELGAQAPLPDGGSVQVLARRVSERLAASPARVALDAETVVEVGRFDFQRFLERATSHRDVGKDLPGAIAKMADGNFEDLAHAALEDRSEDLNAMRYAMDCASGASPARLDAIEEQAPRAIAGRAASFPFPEICAAWGVDPLPQAFRSPFESQVPVLLFSGTFDARTPVSNGDEMLEYFPNGHHVIVERLGHDWCRSRACLELIEAFLVEDGLDRPRVIRLALDDEAGGG